MTSDTVAAETVGRLVETIHAVLGDDLSAGVLTADTLLFGSLPELDSLALVELITAVEEVFGIEIDEDDITAEVFESVGSLAAYLDSV